MKSIEIIVIVLVKELGKSVLFWIIRLVEVPRFMLVNAPIVAFSCWVG